LTKWAAVQSTASSAADRLESPVGLGLEIVAADDPAEGVDSGLSRNKDQSASAHLDDV
jgi:hypothetical protein